MWE
ncbi:hypothetical protein LINPERPRIM_LOCUS32875 [Linum perenne]|jgi:hypothetical protein